MHSRVVAETSHAFADGISASSCFCQRSHTSCIMSSASDTRPSIR